MMSDAKVIEKVGTILIRYCITITIKLGLAEMEHSSNVSCVSRSFAEYAFPVSVVAPSTFAP